MDHKLTAWLRSRGLQKYLAVLQENEVQLADLPFLSDSDLQGLGIALGPRKRILAAARTLAAEETGIGTTSAERRQLTVMFCDLVGSTQLSTQLLGEDLRAINQAYVELSQAAVHRYEGYIANYLGDGILAFFGYPTAHEDEAARAILSAFALLREFRKLSDKTSKGLGVNLELRIGIATGPVLVGDVIGSGTAVQLGVIGEAPNLAARLQDAALPGQILVGERTHALAPSRFEYEELEPRVLKGFTEPIKLWRVISEQETLSGFDASRRRALGTLVGREKETRMIQEACAAMMQGVGQLITVSGEAGIGKSRLVDLTNTWAEEAQCTVLYYQCSPYHETTVLYPILHHLELASGFQQDDGPRAKLDKLEAFLSSLGDVPKKTVAILADLLSIPTTGRYPEFEMRPEDLRRVTMEGLLGVFRLTSRENPILIVFEDVHWADATTLDLLQKLTEDLPSIQALLIVSCRPEFNPTWRNLTHNVNLVLSRLTREQTGQLLLNITEQKPIPEEVLDEIIRKTEGIPLFVEEMTKELIEAKVLIEQADRYVLQEKLENVGIPASLQDFLMARLDRLHSVRDVTQLCATIGRQFSYRLLLQASGQDESRIQSILKNLQDADVISGEGTAPDSSYTFSHALLRDAAYASMLREQRQENHARIVSVLTAEGNSFGAPAEVVARHCGAAEQHERAVHYWHKAIDQSLSRSAYLEALDQIDHALSHVDQLEVGLERQRYELDLQLKKLGPLLPSKGYSSEELQASASRALELARQLGDTEACFPALYARWVSQYVLGRQREAFALSLEHFNLAKEVKNAQALLVGNRIHAVSNLMQGKLELAKMHFDAALDNPESKEDSESPPIYGANIRIQVICYRAFNEALLGRPEQAMHDGVQAIEYARKLQHHTTQAASLWHLGAWLPALLGENETARRNQAELLKIAEGGHMLFWAAICKIYGCLPLAGESASDVARRSEEAIVYYRKTFNANWLLPEVWIRCSELYLRDGKIDQADGLLKKAEKMMSETLEVYWEVELHRVYARSVLAREGTQGYEAAVASLLRALDVAELQKSRWLAVRSALDLAQLLTDKGQPQRAKEVLRQALAPLQEGFEFRDLKNALHFFQQLEGTE